jgi:hypothetical protein
LVCCGTGPFSLAAVILAHVNQAQQGITQTAQERNRLALILGYGGLLLYALAIGGLVLFSGLSTWLPHWYQTFQSSGSSV